MKPSCPVRRVAPASNTCRRQGKTDKISRRRKQENRSSGTDSAWVPQKGEKGRILRFFRHWFRGASLFFLLTASLYAQGTLGSPTAGIVIDGPPPPVPPAVITRDALGRATVRATRIAEPIRIDGRLDESVYTTIPAIDGFIQQEPREGEPASEATEAWVFFDERNVYIAARCRDSNPGAMVANELRRDSFNIFQNDNFAVVLDTFYDRRNAFMFYTNPVGGLSDQYITDERDSNRDWNTVWDVRTQRSEEGWTVEMEIPFKSLRYKPGNPQVWGINFRRVIRSKNEYDYLTRIPRSYGGRGIQKISSAATLVGIEVPSGSANVEIKPYVLGTVKTDLGADIPFSNKVEADAGFDGKYGLTRGLTLDYSFNTDFAQVEDDEQQVNLTRFSLYYPEKRDFFLEGAGIFAFGGAGGRGGGGGGGGGGGFEGSLPSLAPIMFYSRRIGLNDDGEEVPILGGARLTGRAGAYTLGILNIQSRDAPEAETPATNFSVVRVKRDVLRRSSIGMIATHRSRSIEGAGSNQLLGFDAGFVFYENLHIDGYLARTWTPGLRGDDLSYRAALDYSGDRYGLQVEHLRVGSNFNPEIGFLRKEDFRRSVAQARFSPRPRSSRLVRRYRYEAMLDYITDGEGRLETRQAQLSMGIEFNNSDRWSLEYERNREVLDEEFELHDDVIVPPGAYDFQNLRTSFNFGPQRRISGRASLAYGGFYGGHRTEAGFRGRMELSYKFSLEPGVSLNWVDTPWGAAQPHLVSTRINYAFSPRIFLGTLLQYNMGGETLSTNVRFRWEYKPGSDLYVVYSEGRLTDLGGFPRIETRSFAVKFTRLLRF